MECPLCITPLDETELEFYPCVCHYQLCCFCYDKIRSATNQCPGCRKPYDGEAHSPPKRWAEAVKTIPARIDPPPPPLPRLKYTARRSIDSSAGSLTPHSATVYTPPSPANSIIVNCKADGRELGRCTVVLQSSNNAQVDSEMSGMVYRYKNAVLQGSLTAQHAAKILVQHLQSTNTSKNIGRTSANKSIKVPTANVVLAAPQGAWAQHLRGSSLFQ